ncbi:MAG: stage III sporulation protein AA [Lachnospiraceae bacterium]|nr:stage III sporulation protein AA [Lachnospiraceae bacterium]
MESKGRCREQEIYRILPSHLRRMFQELTIHFEGLQEIRLRVGAPVLFRYRGQEYFLGTLGGMSRDSRCAYRINREELQEVVEYISNYSLYAYEEELRQGYLTIRGGHRIGIAGKIILENRQIKSIGNITCLNIRLAHEVLGCGERVLPDLLQGGGLCHTLIVSPPRQGKTTLLRDLIRLLSSGSSELAGMTVGVVDERSEIGACYRGEPQNDLGYRTDILDACPKVEGMMLLVRSMAPEVIAVDEIGSRQDVEAMEYVINSGVKLLATVHGNGIDDVKAKPVLGRLVQEKVFQRYIILGGRRVGEIREVFDERGSLLTTGRELERERAVC